MRIAELVKLGIYLLARIIILIKQIVVELREIVEMAAIDDIIRL